MDNYKIFAVDFDGTLSFGGDWPMPGEPNIALFDFLKQRQAMGDKIILWTCRTEERLQIAIDWCKEQGMIFDVINDNVPEISEAFGNNSRKIYADWYIDDRAVHVEEFFEKIQEELK